LILFTSSIYVFQENSIVIVGVAFSGGVYF
jgi:hypothetical protein